MIRLRAYLAVAALSALTICIGPARAEEGPESAVAEGIEVTADQLEYEADKKLLTGRGNVVVSHGPDVLRADFITVRTDTQDAHAFGNVTHERDGSIWRGDEIRYNFKSRKGDFGTFNAHLDMYHVTAQESERVSASEFVLKRATITTCDSPRPEYRLRASEARVLDNERVVAKHVTFFLGPVPIFYVPRWTRQFAGDKTDIDIVPGYSSRMGPYLLTAYNYRINDVFKASTHLDYRVKRGLGVGQDVEWGDQKLPYHGQARAYYTQDQSPLEKRSDEDIAEYGDLIEKDRYRLKLSDNRSFTPRDNLITEIHYVSDPGIIEDFFNREFRDNAQPENRVSLTHRGDQYSAGLQINKRLNDFYENVNRVPEAFFTVPRLQLGESQFFYETENTASFLEREFKESSGKESYDAFRLDSGHMIYYPTRHFGFLNVMPRAGYRGTYYSKTFEDTYQTNVVSSVDTNGIVSITNEVLTLRRDLGSDVRNLFELGVEVSFKAFGVIHEEPGFFSRDDRGLRHVVEPYARHTYNPEPNLLPESLPQFDSVDTLRKRHDVQLGVRNKFQTKRRNRIHDLLDMDVYTYYRIEKEVNQEDFSDVTFKGRLRLVDMWKLDFDGDFDPYESEFKSFNTQLGIFFPEDTRLTLEYRYQKDRRDQVAGELVLYPDRNWSFSIYERYSFEEGQLEEQSYFLQRKSQCVGYGLGFRKLGEDDIQFWLQLWLLAFPKTSIDLGM